MNRYFLFWIVSGLWCFARCCLSPISWTLHSFIVFCDKLQMLTHTLAAFSACYLWFSWCRVGYKWQCSYGLLSEVLLEGHIYIKFCAASSVWYGIFPFGVLWKEHAWNEFLKCVSVVFFFSFFLCCILWVPYWRRAYLYSWSCHIS